MGEDPHDAASKEFSNSEGLVLPSFDFYFYFCLSLCIGLMAKCVFQNWYEGRSPLSSFTCPSEKATVTF